MHRIKKQLIGPNIMFSFIEMHGFYCELPATTLPANIFDCNKADQTLILHFMGGGSVSVEFSFLSDNARIKGKIIIISSLPSILLSF